MGNNDIILKGADHLQGRISELLMKEEGIELTGFARKFGSGSWKKRSFTTCHADTEPNGVLKNGDGGFSFPMSDLKKIASQTIMKIQAEEIQISGSAERFDRVHLIRNKSRDILKNG